MATSEESPPVVRDVNIAASECDGYGCLITTGPPEKPLTSTQTKSQEPKKRFVGQAEYYCPPREVPQNVTVGRRIFLGGTIEMGNSPDWQREATVALSHLPVTIFNPRRPDWHSDWEPRARNPYFNEQVGWELGLLESSEIIAFYLHPETSSVISLLEIGLYCRTWQGKLALRRPRDDDDPADKARDLPDYEKDPAKTQTQPTTKTILVCCPDGYNRLGNVEIVCHRYGIKMVQTFSELIERVIELVAEPGTEPGIKPRDIEKWRLDKERGGWMDKDTGEHVEERPSLDPTDSPTSKPRFSPIANEVSVPDTIPQIKEFDLETAPSTTSHSRTWFGTQRASETLTSVISRFAS